MRCSVDGRLNRNNKVAFSNLSGIVWTRPKSCYKLIKYYSLPYHLLVPTGSIVGPCFLITYIIYPLLAGIPMIGGFQNYAQM